MTNADATPQEPVHYSFEMPRRASERGETSDLVTVEGVVGPEIAAVRGRRGSTLRVHAVNLGERESLCHSEIRDYDGASDPRDVTCRFCQTRLIAVGLVGADEPQIDPYARLYGGRAWEAQSARRQDASGSEAEQSPGMQRGEPSANAAVTAPLPSEAWTLSAGDLISRVELHKRYGGSGQGGMSRSRTTPNVFLFADPGVGHQHGYFDGWVGSASTTPAWASKATRHSLRGTARS